MSTELHNFTTSQLHNFTTSQLHNFLYLEQVSKESGISTANLAKIFYLETEFHEKILATTNAGERQRQYSDLYNAIHALQSRTDPTFSPNIYRRLVLLFRIELTNKSVLDVGCGRGQFLAEVSRTLPHGDLIGIDTSEIELSAGQIRQNITFLKKDITAFELNQKFDVIFSHQVLEHIAEADFLTHIRSIHAALADSGKFILLMPNKYWGPHDITQIVDNTCTGRVQAVGSHLNESSFSEMVPVLKLYGFRNIRTTLPFAAFLPSLRRIRVKPYFNEFVERSALVRRLMSLPKRHGKPLFKNHVVLVCEKQGSISG
jgi:SAM-dependent methyltransferase